MPADFVFFYEIRVFVNKFNGKQAVCKNSVSLQNVSLADSMVGLWLPYNRFILYWAVLKIRLS